jgi:hypothetical protein
MSTMGAYRSCLELFFAHYSDRNPDSLGEDDIKAYLLDGINRKSWRESTQNSHSNAIKFFMRRYWADHGWLMMSGLVKRIPCRVFSAKRNWVGCSKP